MLIIDNNILDRIKRKNSRARRKMARRYMKKVDKRNIKNYGSYQGLRTLYTENELELNSLGRIRVY